MTENMGDLAAQRARIEVLRSSVGAQLASVRSAAGVSQPQLGQALDRTRSFISKVEHGVRRMPEALWKSADELCQAEGVLITAHSELAQAEQDYRDRCRAARRIPHRQSQPATSAQLDIPRQIWPLPAGLLAAVYQSPIAGEDAAAGPDVVWWPETQGDPALVEELYTVVAKLVHRLGRRQAIRLVGSVLAALGLSGLDADEYTRVAEAVGVPGRVDAQVINNVVATLTICKRQEDKLGPCQVWDTVLAQHQLVRRLLAGDPPEQFRKALHLVESNMAATIGGYLIDMGQFEAASRYFARARRAAHKASNSSYAAYAASNTSFAARLRGDTPTALDAAAAARSLAARTDDAQLKALAEQMAAGAYALDGQYNPCMSAFARAHDILTTTSNIPDSPAYWVHHASIDSHASTFLALLGKPADAVEAASTAQAHLDPTHVARYAMCQVRLGHALALSHDISEAARVLGDAAAHAHLYPRLTTDLYTARALMQPWATTHAVKTLDDQLEACGLLPAATPGPVSKDPR